MSTKNLKIVILSVILIIFGIIVAIFMNYRKMLDRSDISLSSFKQDAQLSLNRVRQIATRNGIKEWRLDAGSAQYNNESKQALLEDLSVTFFLQDGRQLDMTAKEGSVKTDSNDITASGNISVVFGQYRMNTESLHYEHGRRVISAQTPVRIQGDSFDLTADTMSFDLNTKRTALTGNVRGIFVEKIQL
jgi:LPS export ABC transporter protein LptC